MEYHYVVSWSEENGWQIDWELTIAKFKGANVYSPNLDEWLMPVGDSETGDKEVEITEQLENMFEQIHN